MIGKRLRFKSYVIGKAGHIICTAGEKVTSVGHWVLDLGYDLLEKRDVVDEQLEAKLELAAVLLEEKAENIRWSGVR